MVDIITPYGSIFNQNHPKNSSTFRKSLAVFFQSGEFTSLTPGHLGFKILSRHHGKVMYPGQIIEYSVRPLMGIPVYWMTEITHVQDQLYFIDEQRYGPYRMWHHQHHFRPIDGGVEMTDIVHYKMPLSILGKMMNALLVKDQLRKIFSFRFTKTEELFGKWSGQEVNINFY